MRLLQGRWHTSGLVEVKVLCGRWKVHRMTYKCLDKYLGQFSEFKHSVSYERLEGYHRARDVL